MFTLWIHIRAFCTVVLVSCSHPVNWAQCVRVDQWLIPDLVEGYEIWTKQKHPYQSEKDYLKSIRSSNSKNESDGIKTNFKSNDI